MSKSKRPFEPLTVGNPEAGYPAGYEGEPWGRTLDFGNPADLDAGKAPAPCEPFRGRGNPRAVKPTGEFVP